MLYYFILWRTPFPLAPNPHSVGIRGEGGFGVRQNRGGVLGSGNGAFVNTGNNRRFWRQTKLGWGWCGIYKQLSELDITLNFEFPQRGVTKVLMKKKCNLDERWLTRAVSPLQFEVIVVDRANQEMLIPNHLLK